jgi:hypothetical protein
MNSVEHYHFNPNRYEYGGIIITHYGEFEHNNRMCDGGIQINIEGDYRDANMCNARLLRTNEVMIQLPSLSHKWLNHENYDKMDVHLDFPSAKMKEHIMHSQNLMRSAYVKDGNEHLLIRAVVISFDDNFTLSNEVFSPDCINGFDVRTKMNLCPVEITYPHNEQNVTNGFFRACWRFNQIIKNPRTTTVGPNQHDKSLFELNAKFQSMNHSMNL